MPSVAEITADLAAEHDDLDQLVRDLGEEQWRIDTPSPGWTIADQIGHLAYFDRTAALAITDGEAFQKAAAIVVEEAMSRGLDTTLDEPRSLGASDLLAWWRQGRSALVAAAGTLAEDTRLPWYGPAMGAKSFLTARLMETWAHGQDVADTLGRSRQASDRLRHIAQLGVITRGWSYANRGMSPDPTPVQVQLEAPSGGLWEWGDEASDQRVTGPAEDFCQVVTQRRNVADTALVVTGDAAAEWMQLAQAFAGGATSRPPRGTSA